MITMIYYRIWGGTEGEPPDAVFYSVEARGLDIWKHGGDCGLLAQHALRDYCEYHGKVEELTPPWRLALYTEPTGIPEAVYALAVETRKVMAVCEPPVFERFPRSKAVRFECAS